MNKYDGIKKIKCVENCVAIEKDNTERKKNYNSLFLRIIVCSFVLLSLLGLKFINKPSTNKVLYNIKQVVCSDYMAIFDKEK